MFTITEASTKDIPSIIEIAERTWWPTYSSIVSSGQIRYMLDTLYTPQVLKQSMDESSQTFLLLHDETATQGFASFGVRPEETSVIKLHKLYVLPETQGKGYGQRLVDEVKKRMREKNIFTLDVNVNRANKACAFYEKMGFKVIREEDIPIGPFWMTDFVMRLELDH